MANSKKSIEERLAELQKKQEQLKAQERQLKAKKSEEERKKRTHRIATLGGMIEKYCGEISDLEAFEKYLQQYSNAIKATQRKQTIAESVTTTTEREVY